MPATAAAVGLGRARQSGLDARNNNRQRAQRVSNRSRRSAWRWQVTNVLKSLCVAAALALIMSPQLQAAVIVSSKLSSESAMIGQMIRLLLNADGIATVDRMTLGATPVVRKALLSGEIDMYVEYTGNAGLFFNNAADPVWKDLQQGYELGARLDYAANRIVWLTPANASNAWALAVRQDVARANQLKTMSDFGRWVSAGGKVVLACSAEFANAGTLRSLEKTYGFTLRSDQLIVLAGGETSAMIAAAAARTNGTNTAMVYGTDGGIEAANLQILDDDRNDQPIYAPVPMIREAALKANPQIAALVRPLMHSFDRQTLQRLNARVQINGESAESVAEDYLKATSLLK
jgi:osmoprotectant transport system substrate-binding protein